MQKFSLVINSFSLPIFAKHLFIRQQLPEFMVLVAVGKEVDHGGQEAVLRLGARAAEGQQRRAYELHVEK